MLTRRQRTDTAQDRADLTTNQPGPARTLTPYDH